MAANLDSLTTDFRAQLDQLISRCADRGFPMRPYFAIRTPIEQARLWRQSRSIEEINSQMNELSAQGAEFLAECIRVVGPQNGDHVTNSIPGLSWHQWGEAVDSFWLLDGKAEWSTSKKSNGFNGYRVYAEEATTLGLTAGGHWTRFKDWPHVQLRAAGSPRSVFTLQEIDRQMQTRFGTAQG